MISSASFSSSTIRSAVAFRRLSAGKQLLQRFGGAYDCARMLREEVEKPVFPWQKFAKPAEHSIHPFVNFYVPVIKERDAQ